MRAKTRGLEAPALRLRERRNASPVGGGGGEGGLSAAVHSGAASLSGKRGTDESTGPERLTALWAQKRGGVSGTAEPCGRLSVCLKSPFPAHGGAALGLSRHGRHLHRSLSGITLLVPT